MIGSQDLFLSFPRAESKSERIEILGTSSAAIASHLCLSSPIKPLILKTVAYSFAILA